MAQKGSDDKMWGFLAVFLGLLGFIIVLLTKKDSKYAMFYAKQSLAITIVAAVLWIVNFVLIFVPFIGWFISLVLSIGIFVLWILAWVNALSGEMKATPILGGLAEKFNF